MNSTKVIRKICMKTFLVIVYMVTIIPLKLLTQKRKFATSSNKYKSGWVDYEISNHDESIYGEGLIVTSLEQVMTNSSPQNAVSFIHSIRNNFCRLLFCFIFWIVRSEFFDNDVHIPQELPDNQYTLF